MARQPQLSADTLYVTHWPSTNAPEDRVRPECSGLGVQTCQRRVWISTQDAAVRGAAVEQYRGKGAYRFLLEFVSGLHSLIPGETNVMGQFRQAWQRWQAACPDESEPLRAAVDGLLRDAKAIRADHLQGVGGESYGTLVRRLLRASRNERILIVGAGDLASSIWPFFRQYSTACWNRSDARGRVPDWVHVFGPDDGAAAARWAAHVVLTTPPDAGNDSQWQRWLADSRPRSVGHLGHRDGSAFKLRDVDRLFFLDQLFELRRAQANVRSLQLARARVACQEFADRRDARFADPAPRRARA
jgi:hypothetical protein